jgi:hypothetical protein
LLPLSLRERVGERGYFLVTALFYPLILAFSRREKGFFFNG